MTTHESLRRSREVVDQILDLITGRIASVPEEEIDDEMIALAIGLRTWASVIETCLPEEDQAYVRQLSTRLTGSSGAS